MLTRTIDSKANVEVGLMQRFITIDEKIISFDLEDVMINLYPKRDHFRSRKWEHVFHVEDGQFILKVLDLRIIEPFIPPHLTPSFQLEVYEGDKTDKSTWKLIQRLSRCRFDISTDKDHYKRWLESLPILQTPSVLQIPPSKYQLSGTFEYYQDESANCEVI